MGDSQSKMSHREARSECHDCKNSAHCGAVKTYHNIKKLPQCPECQHETSLSFLVMVLQPKYSSKNMYICDHTTKIEHHVTKKIELHDSFFSAGRDHRSLKITKCPCTHSWHELGGIKEEFECKQCHCQKCTEVPKVSLNEWLGNYPSIDQVDEPQKPVSRDDSVYHDPAYETVLLEGHHDSVYHDPAYETVLLEGS